jgi:hypothetical protein
MNGNGAALLTNPHPCGHIVYPYTDENLVGQAVCLFATAGLLAGEGVLLITSAEHYAPIRRRIQAEVHDLVEYERSGRLTSVKTEDLMARFMNNGVIDEDRFRLAISGLINKVRTSTLGKVRVFGEMVSQLRTTNLTATTRLEELWNEVIKEHSVALLCTYALHNAEDHIPDALIDLHAQSIERDAELSGTRRDRAATT